MKLLLTSNGITNPAMADALFELAGAPAPRLNLAYIPTASTIRDEDKCWLIDDLARFRGLGFAKLDIVDLAALTREQARPRLEQANILVFGGGNVRFLLGCIEEKLQGCLNKLVQTRVLVGISAGSVMCCPEINPEKDPGFGYTGFMFIPHMGSDFAGRTRGDIEGFAKAVGRRTYWADDSSGVLVNGDEVRTVGTGSVEVIEP